MNTPILKYVVLLISLCTNSTKKLFKTEIVFFTSQPFSLLHKNPISSDVNSQQKSTIEFSFGMRWFL